MKKKLLFLITLFSISFLYAQNNSNNAPRSNEEFFTQAELVIEGQFMRVVATYDTKGKGNYEDCYRINAIHVKKVFKGDPSLAGTTIYVVRKGAHLGEEEDYERESVIDGILTVREICDAYFVPGLFSKNGIDSGVNSFTPSVYFFKTSNLPDDKNSEYFSYKKYVHIEENKGDSEPHNFMYVCGDIIAGLDELIFRNREDFYNYMRRFEGFVIPEQNNFPEKQYGKVVSNEAVSDSLRCTHKTELDSIRNLFMKEYLLKDSKKKKQKNPKKEH